MRQAYQGVMRADWILRRHTARFVTIRSKKGGNTRTPDRPLHSDCRQYHRQDLDSVKSVRFISALGLVDSSFHFRLIGAYQPHRIVQLVIAKDHKRFTSAFARSIKDFAVLLGVD